MIVELDMVTAGYGGKDALAGLSLRVPQGAVYALLGRNGAGKTTAIRCLLGQLRAVGGDVRLFGRDAWRERAKLLERVGVVPETPDAPPGMTVKRLIAFSRALYAKWDGDALAARLAKAKIDPSAAFGSLSRGQRAHVLLALALAPSPDLLIL